MAVNLRKVAKDLAGDDEDVRILALTTVVQLSPASIKEPADLLYLKERLAEAVESADPDTVFLARKGMNHVEQLLETSGPGRQKIPASPPQESPTELTREQALETLANVGDDPVELSRGLAALHRAGPQREDCERILSLLAHQDARVRANSVEVLEAIGDERLLVEHLPPLLDDPNNRVRANASKALGGLGLPRVQEVLAAMVGSGNLSERESGVYAMGFLKGSEIVTLLVRTLRDPYEGIRLRAVKALARHKDPSVLPALRIALNDMDIDVCEEADRAIRFILLESPQPVREGFGDSPETSEAGGTPAPTPPLTPADNERERLRARRLDELREVGRRVFDLCRDGALQAVPLDRVFYDTQKLRDFLAKHQERAASGGDVETEEAMQDLEERIAGGERRLGELALELASSRQIELPDAALILGTLSEIDKKLQGSE